MRFRRRRFGRRRSRGRRRFGRRRRVMVIGQRM